MSRFSTALLLSTLVTGCAPGASPDDIHAWIDKFNVYQGLTPATSELPLATVDAALHELKPTDWQPQSLRLSVQDGLESVEIDSKILIPWRDPERNGKPLTLAIAADVPAHSAVEALTAMSKAGHNQVTLLLKGAEPFVAPSPNPNTTKTLRTKLKALGNDMEAKNKHIIQLLHAASSGCPQLQYAKELFTDPAVPPDLREEIMLQEIRTAAYKCGPEKAIEFASIVAGLTAPRPAGYRLAIWPDPKAKPMQVPRDMKWAQLAPRLVAQPRPFRILLQ